MKDYHRRILCPRLPLRTICRYRTSTARHLELRPTDVPRSWAICTRIGLSVRYAHLERVHSIDQCSCVCCGYQYVDRRTATAPRGQVLEVRRYHLYVELEARGMFSAEPREVLHLLLILVRAVSGRSRLWPAGPGASIDRPTCARHHPPSRHDSRS